MFDKRCFFLAAGLVTCAMCIIYLFVTNGIQIHIISNDSKVGRCANNLSAIGKQEQSAREIKRRNCSTCRVYDLTSPSSQFNYTCVSMRIVPATPICLYPRHQDSAMSGIYWKGQMFEAVEVRMVKEWLNADPEMGLIDLGANIGTFTLSIAAMGRNVVSVEPNMENVRHLHKAVNLGKLEHRITLLANALSSERGVSKIIYSRDNQGDTRTKHIPVLPDMDYGGDNYSRFIVLDDLVPFCKFKSAVIKIDIQGFEVNAFADADELFDKIHIPYIFMEWVMVKAFNPMKAPHEESELFYRMMTFFKHRAYLPMDQSNKNTLSWANWKAWPFNIVWNKQSGKMHSGQPK